MEGDQNVLSLHSGADAPSLEWLFFFLYYYVLGYLGGQIQVISGIRASQARPGRAAPSGGGGGCTILVDATTTGHLVKVKSLTWRNKRGKIPSRFDQPVSSCYPEIAAPCAGQSQRKHRILFEMLEIKIHMCVCMCVHLNATLSSVRDRCCKMCRQSEMTNKQNYIMVDLYIRSKTATYPSKL